MPHPKPAPVAALIGTRPKLCPYLKLSSLQNSGGKLMYPVRG
jgi:hypothetical protein